MVVVDFRGGCEWVDVSLEMDVSSIVLVLRLLQLVLKFGWGVEEESICDGERGQAECG